MKALKKILCTALFVFVALLFVGCNTTKEKKDFAGQLKLETSYKDKEFVKDGIGQVTLYQNVDGDTAWFKSGNAEIKIRFVSVDTPESTGQIEPWGKAASKFTGEILEKAKLIVLEAEDGKTAKFDSTGTRYLAFIWYSLDGISELRNLNLELVQEGYSFSKVTKGAKYEKEFTEAATQSLKLKLRVFSDEADPDYDNSNGVNLTLKDLSEKAQDYFGNRVNFEAVVTRVYSNYAYVENEVDGKRYGMLVYLGYQSVLKQAFKEGYKLKVHGFVQAYNGIYQISGCYYDMFELGKPADAPEYAQCVRVLDRNAALTPTEITANVLNSGEAQLRTLVTIKHLHVDSVYSSSAIVEDSFAKEMTLTCSITNSTAKVQIRVIELYEKGNPVTESFFKNKNISSLTGIVDIYNGTYQIRLVNLDDILM